MIEVKVLLFLTFLFEFEYVNFFPFFNKKSCFNDWVILYFILLPYCFYERSERKMIAGVPEFSSTLRGKELQSKFKHTRNFFIFF